MDQARGSVEEEGPALWVCFRQADYGGWEVMVVSTGLGEDSAVSGPFSYGAGSRGEATGPVVPVDEGLMRDDLRAVANVWERVK